MGLTRQQIDALLKAIVLTKSNELNCDECLNDLAEFAERWLEGQSTEQGRKAIEHHLTICPECNEEYEALLEALKQSTDDGP